MKDSTRIILIVDASGSMSPYTTDTIAGVNKFIRDQKELGDNASFTLVEFDTVVKERFVGVPIAEMTEYSDYYTRGFTALYDAIGQTFVNEGRRLESMPEQERPDKVVVGIITDGDENSSVEYKGQSGQLAVKQMIEHQQSKYGWVVEFLAKDLGVARQGIDLGVKSVSAYKSIHDAYFTMNCSTRSVRSGS